MAGLLKGKLTNILEEFEDDLLAGDVKESFTDLIGRRKNNLIYKMNVTLSEYKKNWYADKQLLVNALVCEDDLPFDKFSIITKDDMIIFSRKILGNIHKYASYNSKDRTINYESNGFKDNDDVFEQKNNKYNIVKYRTEQLNSSSSEKGTFSENNSSSRENFVKRTFFDVLKWICFIVILSLIYNQYPLDNIWVYGIWCFGAILSVWSLLCSTIIMLVSLILLVFLKFEASKVTKPDDTKHKAEKYIKLLGKDLDDYIKILQLD